MKQNVQRTLLNQVAQDMEIQVDCLVINDFISLFRHLYLGTKLLLSKVINVAKLGLVISATNAPA